MYFKDLSNHQLRILCNSLNLDYCHPVRMYRNSYGINPEICKDFFEGYFGYLISLAKSVNGCTRSNEWQVALAQDSYDNLIDYRKMYEQKQVDKARKIRRY